MNTRTHEETSGIENDGLAVTKLPCFIAAAVLILCAVYLLGGAVLRLLTEFPPLFFWNGWTFTGTIIFAVIIGAMAFLFWLAAYGELIRSRMICATCQHDLSKVACPECGKTRENIVSGMSDKTVPQDSSQQGSLAVSKLRGIRFMGGSLLAIAALFLFLVGIFHHIAVPLIQGFAKTPAELFAVFTWEAHFQDGVAIAVLVATVGFCIWFISYRRLARASWLCPSCSYDLSGMPCPECNAASDTE